MTLWSAAPTQSCVSVPVQRHLIDLMSDTLSADPAALPSPKTAADSRKSRRTRARILESAMRLFVEVGYAAATNPRIAEAAGLTRGAMLYHFPSREALGRNRARTYGHGSILNYKILYAQLHFVDQCVDGTR